MKNRTAIGKRIKELRINNKLSQSYIADKLYITQSAYSLIENSQNGIVTDHIIKLSEFYDVTTDFLLKGEKMLVKISFDNGFLPYINKHAHAGFIENYHDAFNYEEYEWYRIPGFNPTIGQKLFEVEGESMSPTILPGDVVICQEQKNLDNILDGSLILFVTQNGIFIKRVRLASSNTHLMLEGDNENIHDGIDKIEKKDIYEALSIRGKISSVLVPHHQISSNGKMKSLEESIELLKKELYLVQKKLNHYTHKKN